MYGATAWQAANFTNQVMSQNDQTKLTVMEVEKGCGNAGHWLEAPDSGTVLMARVYLLVKKCLSVIFLCFLFRDSGWHDYSY